MNEVSFLFILQNPYLSYNNTAYKKRKGKINEEEKYRSFHNSYIINLWDIWNILVYLFNK